MSPFPPDILARAKALVALCAERKLLVATAESCTGGLIAAALTEVTGSSAVVDRGFVTYSNAAKMELIGVEAATLDAFGAVSRQTAVEMVSGALCRSSADIAVSVTGIAGPGGGSAQKPVGLVHLAARRRGGAVIHREMRYGDIGRAEVRLATLGTALDLLSEAALQEV
ncbi:CinA family protein [Ensifer soli]|uniref:CinA family protein n=1 Tax=Ciceribacter sp. sgz301302 TaxID=3342379 RepID=UPI0035B7BD60